MPTATEPGVHLPFPVGPSEPLARHTAPTDAPAAAWLPWLEDRSPNPWVCPFLRAADDADGLGLPVEAPDAANRCAALREAVPQSLRQQELVCLTSGHVNCPRYLRGAAVATDRIEPVVRPRPAIRPAILVSALLVVAAFALSAAFVVARGGFQIDASLIASPAPAASSTALAVASLAASGAPVTAAPSSAASHPVPASASAAASATASPAVTPAPTPTPTATAAPTPQPTPVATEAPKPTAAPTKKPTSDRYLLLTACANRPDCYVYRVRAGDNLYSIANYFGVSMQTVRRLNPWTATTSLRAGQQLILPPPRR